MLNKETEYIDTWRNKAYVFKKTDNKKTVEPWGSVISYDKLQL